MLYELIEGASREDLVTRVNNKTAKGWKVVVGPTVIIDNNGHVRYMQAIIKAAQPELSDEQM